MKKISWGGRQRLGNGVHHLIYMRILVFLQSSLLNEAFATKPTLQWFLTCVCHFMIFSVSFQMETFLAKAAFELLSIDVNFLVSFQKYKF